MSDTSGLTGPSDTSGGMDGGSDSNGMGDDSCSDNLAGGLSMREVAFYQVVKVPVMSDAIAIEPEARNVDLIQGRAAIVRVSVDVEPDWAPRSISARVHVSSGQGQAQIYFNKKMVMQSSLDDDPSTSFIIDLPQEVITNSTTYSIVMTECDEGTDSPVSPQARFPMDGEAPLGAVETDGLKIHLVPFEIAGFVPDTSEATLNGFREAILSVYPVTDVELSVGDVIADENNGTVDMGDLLVRLGVQKDNDRVPANLYYYGLVTGAATREEFCDSCPTGTSESGGGISVGFSVGAAFADQKSEDTLIHELGHMHGMLHAPCGDPDLLDEDYPYDDAAIAVEGYDFRTQQFIPPDQKDLMSYCFPRWVSDYNYQRMVDWVIQVSDWDVNPPSERSWPASVRTACQLSRSRALPAFGKPELGHPPIARGHTPEIQRVPVAPRAPSNTP